MGRGSYLKALATRKKAKRRERCREKIAYPTQDEADLAAKATGTDLVSYKCEFDNHYHVAHRKIRPVVFSRFKRSF